MYLPMDGGPGLTALRHGLLECHRSIQEMSGAAAKAKQRNDPARQARRKVLEARERERREREFILKQFKADQREKEETRASRAPAQASVGNKLQFGGNLNDYKSCGVDLNKKGG